ncbi:peptidase inhibitor family I36 protein [Streptomyces calvus]|jgi:hypothetical protein|uniref:peptidase inhibitor family I36 protein n=1 Tax=Streptomyces calvus TaxID=67282 RepID=UPI00371A0C93
MLATTGVLGKSGRVLAGAATLAGLLLAAPAAAHAHSADSADDPATACPFSRTLCLFDSTGYTGARFAVQSRSPSETVCVDLVAHGWGDRARSAVNTGTRAAHLYSSSDCTGTPVTVTGAASSLPLQGGSVRVS